MNLIVNVSPYHAEIVDLIRLHYTELSEEYDIDRSRFQADFRVIYDIIVKTAMADALTDLNQYISETIYKYLTFNRMNVSLVLISHMVCEILESRSYQKLRKKVNTVVSSSGHTQFGILDINSATFFGRLNVTVAANTGVYNENNHRSARV